MSYVVQSPCFPTLLWAPKTLISTFGPPSFSSAQLTAEPRPLLAAVAARPRGQMVQHEWLHVAALGVAVRRTRRAQPVQVALPAPKVVHPLLPRSFPLPAPTLVMLGELHREARLDLLAREQHWTVHDQRPSRPDPASRALGKDCLRGLVYWVLCLSLLLWWWSLRGGGRNTSTSTSTSGTSTVVADAAAASPAAAATAANGCGR